MHVKNKLLMLSNVFDSTKQMKKNKEKDEKTFLNRNHSAFRLLELNIFEILYAKCINEQRNSTELF